MGLIPRSLLRNLFPKLALGFIPVIDVGEEHGSTSGIVENERKSNEPLKPIVALLATPTELFVAPFE